MAFADPNSFEAVDPIDTLSINPENPDLWYYCSHTYTPDQKNLNVDNNVIDQTVHNKDSKFTYNHENKHLKKMDSLICNAHDMLKQYFNPKYAKYHIPYNFFHECKGIMFLRIWKAGLLIGGIGGTGIVMAHNNGEWSNPCAVSLSGIQFGLDVGVETVDDILLLRDDVVLKLLVENGHCKFGSDASIVTDPFGTDNNVDVKSGGKPSSVYAYSFSNGAFVGLSLNSGTVSINNSVNDEFYDNRKIEPKDMLYGDIVIPQNGDFFQLKQLLKDYSTNESKSVNEPVSDQNVMNPILNQ